jgi:rubrerythrin
MAMEARKEGFVEIANRMEGVAAIEKTHERRYRDLLNSVKSKNVFKRSTNVI